MLQELRNDYPGHEMVPFLPVKYECGQMSVLMVPKDLVPEAIRYKSIAEFWNDETKALINGQAVITQELHRLKEKYRLKVVVLENYFAKRVASELNAAGYKTQTYYETSFVVGTTPVKVVQDVLYSAVTDVCTVKEWSLTDNAFHDWLGSKGLTVPHYSEEFLNGMRLKGEKIMGAEVLVIEATKQ